ncbi:hypothetical protein XENOCAPTIV_000837 [Xenoophorus captivus]|uniref:Fibrillar collagen NC1 domain-containing protein n=1 Tax=Xenoophorus captivus TaxID=1517983 RepID=A0ABV0QP56_9TELE
MDSNGEPVGVVQLGFLRLLSVQARQNLTYHCHRSVAWADRSAKNNHKRALHFRGANDEELSYETSPYIKALIDGCSYRKGFDRTVLEINTPQLEHLPLLDIKVTDFGESNQQFGFENCRQFPPRCKRVRPHDLSRITDRFHPELPQRGFSAAVIDTLRFNPLLSSM